MIRNYWKLFPVKKHSRSYNYSKRHHRIIAKHENNKLANEFVDFVLEKKMPIHLFKCIKEGKRFKDKDKHIVLKSFKPIIIDENYDKQGLIGEYFCWLSISYMHNQTELIYVPTVEPSTTGRGLDFYELYVPKKAPGKIHLRIWEAKAKPKESQIKDTGKTVIKFFSEGMYVYLADLVADLQRSPDPNISYQFSEHGELYTDGNRLERAVFIVCDEDYISLIDEGLSDFSKKVIGPKNVRQVVSLGLDNNSISTEELIAAFEHKIIAKLEKCYPDIRKDIAIAKKI